MSAAPLPHNRRSATPPAHASCAHSSASSTGNDVDMTGQMQRAATSLPGQPSNDPAAGDLDSAPLPNCSTWRLCDESPVVRCESFAGGCRLDSSCTPRAGSQPGSRRSREAHSTIGSARAPARHRGPRRARRRRIDSLATACGTICDRRFGAALPQSRAVGRPAGRRSARSHDTRGEDRPDDAGRAGGRGRQSHADPDPAAGVGALRRRLHARREQPRVLGRDGQLFSGTGPRHPAGHPADLRHRRRTRTRQRLRRDDLPAQRRARLHPRPETRRAGRRGHSGRGARDRHPVELLAVRLRGTRRAVGPQL
jgi:hypothetical protein